MTTLAIHTDCPILPLTRMVGDTANIEVGQAVGGGGPDCFYGWHEPVSTRACRPHHIVWGCDPEETLWMAKTLARLDHQVVVTQPVADDQFGDHRVVESFNYDDNHSH